MFQRKRAPSVLKPVPHREEGSLREALEADCWENVYLLGLLQDYSLQGLHRMGWGEFYLISEPFPQVLYQDVTGLAVLSRAEAEGLARFADFLEIAPIRTTRIIARSETASDLHRRLTEKSTDWPALRAEFPEIGMALTPKSLSCLSEPALRHARFEEAEAIADGSVKAMHEELGISTTPRDYDRLLKSKADLIERNRYFVLEDGGRILFQAYLSAHMEEASQVQGVWVPLEHRNEGIATRCLAEMCRRCFEMTRALVLRVQVRNGSAVRTYEKVGFRNFLDYRSIWYI